MSGRHCPCLPPGPVFEHTGLNNSQLARKVGVSVRTVRRWRGGHNLLSPTTAETVADRLGLHPSHLWADWYGRVVPGCGTARGYKQGCRCRSCWAAFSARRAARSHGPVVAG